MGKPKAWRGVCFTGTTKEWDTVQPRDKITLQVLKEGDPGYTRTVIPDGCTQPLPAHVRKALKALPAWTPPEGCTGDDAELLKAQIKYKAADSKRRKKTS